VEVVVVSEEEKTEMKWKKEKEQKKYTS